MRAHFSGATTGSESAQEMSGGEGGRVAEEPTAARRVEVVVVIVLSPPLPQGCPYILPRPIHCIAVMGICPVSSSCLTFTQ